MGRKTSGVLYTVGSQETTVGVGVERTCRARLLLCPCTFTASSCYKRVKLPGLRQASSANVKS